MSGSAIVQRARALATSAVGERRAISGSGDGSINAVLEHAADCASILAGIDADDGAIAAAWLYGQADAIPLERIGAEFGADIARIVDGMRRVRRLGEIHGDQGRQRGNRDAELRLETLRRMLLALSVDVRVVLLRLASRLATLRRYARRHETPDPALCRETLDVLAPLANRLGIWVLKWQLEDLAFRFLEPKAYHDLARAVEHKRADRERLIATSIERLAQAFRSAGIEAEVLGRPKHLYSLVSKMRSKNLRIDQVHDLHALRAIVADVPVCYQALDVVHALWTPVAGEYDDYISAPKGNGYQSLHTVVTRDDGARLEVQIRTREMDEAAEYGDASHWRYKEGIAGTGKDGFARRIGWLRQLLAWQRDIGLSIGAATADGQPDPTVYAMTPQGQVIALPMGATPIDFAYAIHTELGHRCRGARVDGVMVPLSRPLLTGQTVEIILARGQERLAAGPSRDWLNPELGYLASTRARTKVRQWFAAHDASGESPASASSAVGAASLLPTGATMVSVAGAPSGDARFGGRSLNSPADAGSPLAGETRAGRRRRRDRVDSQVLIEGVGSLMTQLARCCRPIPPDPIAGYVTRGSGVTVHRRECGVWQQLRANVPERVVNASWALPAASAPTPAGRASRRRPAGGSNGGGFRYPVDLEVVGPAGEGLLQDIAELLARDRISLLAATRSDRGDTGQLRMTVELDGALGLPELLARIQRLPGVVMARRR